MSEWVQTTLGEVATLIRGVSYKSSELVETGGRPFFNLKSINRGGGYRVDGLKRFAGASRPAQVVLPGDILIACTDLTRDKAILGYPLIAPSGLDGDATFSLDLAKVEITSGSTNPEYLALVLQAPSAHAFMTAHSSGTTVIHLKTREVPRLPIPLPPLAEQRRIVDVMAAVDAQIEALVEEIELLSIATDRLRADAFEGVIAPQIPAGEMFDMLLGRQKSARQSVGDHVLPYLRAANISAGTLKLDDVQTMNFELHEQERYGLQDGDIVLVEGGSLGQAARWSGEIDGVVGFDKHVIRLRARESLSVSEYALQWCHYARQTGAFADQATGITIKALGFGRASAMPVPDLTVEDQVRLVAPIAASEAESLALSSELATLRAFRSTLLTSLLCQELEIPESYDKAFLLELEEAL